MAVIIEKQETDGSKSKYILIGAGRVPSNFGAKEEPFVTVCDYSGNIKVLTNYADSVKVIEVNGKKPEELLKK